MVECGVSVACGGEVVVVLYGMEREVRVNCPGGVVYDVVELVLTGWYWYCLVFVIIRLKFASSSVQV